MSTQRVNDDSFVNEMHVIRHEDRGESSQQDGSSGARMDGGPYPVAMAGPVGGFFTFKPSGAVFRSFLTALKLAYSGLKVRYAHRMDSVVAPFVVHGVSV
jgi:hypothetical protein